MDVIYTNDGKEYITPKYLSKEVLDELQVNGGRVNLVEVARALNVDLSKVNSCFSILRISKYISFNKFKFWRI